MRLPDDPIIRELLPEFCAMWDTYLEGAWWPGILTSRDSQELYRFAHTVRGSFAQFRLPDGAELGRELVAAARAGDWDACEALVERLRGRLRDLKAALPPPRAP